MACLHSQKHAHPHLYYTYSAYIHRYSWARNHVSHLESFPCSLKVIKHTDRGIWAQATTGPIVRRASMQREWEPTVIMVDPHPLLHPYCISPSTVIPDVFQLYFCKSDTETPWSHSLTSILPFHVASLFKYDMSSIHSMQEGSVPIMCVWLSFGCCKQAGEMWMRLTLPDWLSVLAPGYKHAFLVIYRCGVVSHEASG